jgi:hypothetical protein
MSSPYTTTFTLFAFLYRFTLDSARNLAFGGKSSISMAEKALRPSAA